MVAREMRGQHKSKRFDNDRTNRRANDARNKFDFGRYSVDNNLDESDEDNFDIAAE
jgi:hypothetical protein